MYHIAGKFGRELLSFNWQFVKFGSLTVCLCNSQIYLHIYMCKYIHMYGDPIPNYQILNLSMLYISIAILGSTTKFNSFQYFQLSQYCVPYL